MGKRVFLFVLDSVGIGALPDAEEYGDVGSNTLLSCSTSTSFDMPNLKEWGLFNIDLVPLQGVSQPKAAFGAMAEQSKGKDTTIGHWEIAGIISPKPLPTYPQGFPEDVINSFVEKTGRGILCNKPYSGTKLLEDYGREHIETGKLLVYTSADSVFQIAAHESVVSVEELYRCCAIARELLQGEHGVGRVIARPFIGEYPNYTRTSNRHDYSLPPQGTTMLDVLMEAGMDTVGVGKISDIFDGVGISKSIKTTSNSHGMQVASQLAQQDFTGLCFINLVDFDMKYGHRNDVEGYAQALTTLDGEMKAFSQLLGDEDMVIITADHGCDPRTPSTDHSREYVPLLVYGKSVKSGINLGIRQSFSDIAATILEYFSLHGNIHGCSFLKEIL